MTEAAVSVHCFNANQINIVKKCIQNLREKIELSCNQMKNVNILLQGKNKTEDKQVSILV